jgi:hypothetical protein
MYISKIFDVFVLTTIVLVVLEVSEVVNLGWWTVTSLLWIPLLSSVVIHLIFRIMKPVGNK